MRTIRFPLQLSCALLCSAFFSNSTFAATNTWTQLVSGNASGNWNTAANPPWSLAAIPVAGDTAIFSNLNITVNSFVTLGADQSIDAIFFGDTVTSSAATWIVTNSFGSLNTLTLSGPEPVAVVNQGTAGLDVPVLGTSGFTKLGAGTLTLTNLNTFTGNVVIRQGVLGIYQGDGTGTSGTLGTVPGSVTPDNLTINGGTLYNNSSRNFISQCRLHPNRGITIGSSGGTIQVNNAGFFMAIQGPLSGSGNLTKLLGGTVCFDGDTTAFTGKYLVNQGFVTFGGTHNPPSYVPDAVIFNGGGLNNNNGLGALITYTVPANLGITLGASGGIFQIETTGGGVGDIVDSIITGPGALTKSGLGYLTLNGLNSYTGGTIISNAWPVIPHTFCAVQLGHGGALGTGTVTFQNTTNINGLSYLGTVLNAGNLVPNNFVLSAAAGMTNRWFIDQNTSVTFAGTISGHSPSSVWVKDGLGTMTLPAVNTYTGTNGIIGGKIFGVTGGSCSNANIVITPFSDPTGLGVLVTDNTKRWTCNNLEINSASFTPTLDFTFTVAGSTTIAPLNVRSNVAFNGTPNVTVYAATLPISTGDGYPLMTWGSVSGTPPTTGNLTIVPAGVSGSLSVVGNTLYLQITDTYEPLRWAAGNSSWDFSSANWMNSAAVPALTSFQEGDAVQFEDTQNPTAGAIISLDGTVSPASVLVNSTNDYTITGSSDSVIAGLGPLTKSGSGTLTISGPGGYTFSGGMTVNGGTVIASKPDATFYGSIGNGNLAINSGTRVIATGDNSLAGTSTSNAKTITVNSGAVLTNMGTTTCRLNRLVLNGGTLAATTANSTFGNWALDFGVSTLGNTNSSLITGGNIALSQGTSTIFNVGTGDTLTVDSAIDHTTSSADSGLTKNGNGTLVLTGPDSSQGAFTMNGGTLTMLGQHSGTNAVTLSSGTLRLGAGTVVPSGPMAVATVTVSSTDSTPRVISNSITLGTGNSRTTHGDGVGTGKITYTGPVVVLTGSTGRTLTNHVDVEFSGNITGSNGPFTNRGAGTLTLSGTNTVAWSGGWNILGGALVVNGAIHSATPVFLTNGTTLSGTGLVSAPIIVAPGSKILPGSSIGTLTVTNSPSWTGGTVLMELNLANSQTSDRLLRTSGGFNFAGANLIVTNIGPALTNGSTFTLFPAGNTGSFASVTLPPLTGTLSWNTSTLTSSGTISVINVSTVPTNITFSVTGGQLNLSWPGDHLGWTLQAQTNPITTGITTNWFDVPGTSAATNYSAPINPLNPTVFYRLRY